MIIFFIHVERPSRSSFPTFSKQNKFKAKVIFATGETVGVGLAEWIIDDTCLVCNNCIWEGRIERKKVCMIQYQQDIHLNKK